MTFYSFFLEYKWVLLFYSIVILLIYLNRSRFEFQGKIVALLRTKKGIDTIHRIGKKHSELIKIIGYIGIGIGFIGLLAISGMMIKALWDLFFIPNAPPAVTPVIPGVKIPGSPIFVPLFYGIFALFFVVVIHEFSHGIVAAAHGLKIKSTGIAFFGPIIGAFVEPDEKELIKKEDTAQYSIYAAGPFSNILLGLFALAIMAFVLTPINGAINNDVGVTFTAVQNNTPAEKYGLTPNMTIIKIDDSNVKNMNDFQSFLDTTRPNQTITIYSSDGKVTNLTMTAHPDNPKKGYMGIIGSRTVTKLKVEDTLFKGIDMIIKFFAELFFWIYLLSLGIGLANLLPIGPVDGGRMLQVALRKTTGNDKKGDAIWGKITVITILVLLVLVFVPILKTIFSAVF